MIITKREHACLVVEEAGQKIVIDPGSFMQPPADLTGVVAVVVTDAHQDHFSNKNLQAIVARNPAVRIFGTAEAAKEAADLPITAVTGGGAETVGPFSLAFFGELHAEIHPEIPRTQNIGVLVNTKLYYAGDSFTEPGVPVAVLALPVSAPWLKEREVLDYLVALKPKQAFGTHDALLSDIGHMIVDGLVQRFAEMKGIPYAALKPGDSITL